MKYHEMSGFEEVYFEDSFVLGVCLTLETIEINMDLVLRENHRLYDKPDSNEQHCYIKAKLSFNNVGKFSFVKSSAGYQDATGETDFGNIDTFEYEKGVYRLVGDWGELEVSSSPPTLEINGGQES